MTKKYLDYILNPIELLRTQKVLHVNPTVTPERIEPELIDITVLEYNIDKVERFQLKSIEETYAFSATPSNSWINIDGLRKADVDKICEHYGIHSLIVEDILSIGQRPKMDELNGFIFCLMNMLYFNEETSSVEAEQVSIILGKNFVITFQEIANKDVFDTVREKIKINGSKVRLAGVDFLFYMLLDSIVDHYFLVMDKLGDKIELLEEDIIRKANKRSLAKINVLRKEMILLKRNITPVRDLLTGILRSESELLDERTEKYFKDVYDHIILANDLADNYRDMMMNLHDLYMSTVNLRLNEVMKVMTVVTCLLAPATVIGGIFGMNFDVIPFAHHQLGFYSTVAVMLLVPVIMLIIFRKRGWF